MNRTDLKALADCANNLNERLSIWAEDHADTLTDDVARAVELMDEVALYLESARRSQDL